MKKIRALDKFISIVISALIILSLVTVSGMSNVVFAATTYTVIFPVNNGCKIAYYQEYDPNYSGHDGVDIHSSGDDTIYAAYAGTVVGIGNSCPHVNELSNHLNGKYDEMGNYIKIKGNDGIYYWYYHLKQNTMVVSTNDKVVAGQPIATMGSSGASSGKHLHFRMTTGSSYYSTAIIANPVGKYSGQVNYKDGPYNPTDITLSSISVATKPSTTVYENGTAFNTRGMVITAKYSDGTSKNVTGYKTSYDFSKTGNVNVTISYTEGGVTKTVTQAVTVQDVFKGSGTESDPYKISTAADLNNLAKQINNIKAVGCYGGASYIQKADIKVGTMTEPIGSCYENSTSETISLLAVFKGHYNGNYHKLYDVKLDYSRSYAGIFGKIGGAGIVENLAVYGDIKGVNFVGGIVGEEGYGSTIRNCSFNGTITADGIAGGIVGRNQNGGIISGCYANADITVNNSYVGGLTGYAVAGENESSSNVVVENSYFVGTLKGEINGGIAGSTKLETVKECTITFTNCYYLNSASTGAVNSKEQTGCKALSSDTLKTTGAAVLGTPFTAPGDDLNDGYPVFKWQIIPFNGSGTQEDPYQISTLRELEALRDLVNDINAPESYRTAYYIQTADIIVGDYSEPIGSCYENNTSDTISLVAVFKGYYNGNNHKLYGVNMDYSRSYAGIFGKTGGASVVENLAVYGSIKGVNYVGGIIGEEGYGATIKNCSFNGTVNGSSAVGGIVGRNINGGIISNCYANAEVTASEGYAGGLTGYATAGGNTTSSNITIDNSYFVGVVNGTNCGGIAGDAKLETAKECTITFTSCYYLDTAAAGAVNGKEQVGCNDLPSANLKSAGAELLGTPFVTSYFYLNDGYPVFDWQNVLLGDVNDDKSLSVKDAVMLKKYLLKSGELGNTDEADIDRNNKINVFDFIIMKRLLTGNN